jgi:hypothetical protein
MTGHWYKFRWSIKSHYFLDNGTLDGALSFCGDWSLLKKEYRREDGALSNCKKCAAALVSAVKGNKDGKI